jgi:hypothetical protein
MLLDLQAHFVNGNRIVKEEHPRDTSIDIEPFRQIRLKQPADLASWSTSLRQGFEVGGNQLVLIIGMRPPDC